MYNDQTNQNYQNQPNQEGTNAEKAMKKPEKEKIFDTKKIILSVLGSIVGVVVIVAAAVALIQFLTKPKPTDEPTPTETATEPETPEPTVPTQISLQNAVDQWVDSQANKTNSGIIIYDLNNNAVVARHNEDEKFRIESIYKMFVAYEGYYRIDSKQWSGDENLGLGNDFSGKPYTLSLCLDHMVRFSYSPCAEKVWGMIGAGNLQAAYEAKGFKDTSIAGLTSTPSDLMKLYQQYWKHTDLSDDSWRKIQDSMLNQTAPSSASPAYTNNWRQGFPSGFATALVYDKVGWYGDGNGNWYFYDDAAFVTFPAVQKNKAGEKKLARNYIMIVLTKDTNAKELVKLGRKIEETVKAADNY